MYSVVSYHGQGGGLSDDGCCSLVVRVFDAGVAAAQQLLVLGDVMIACRVFSSVAVYF